MSLCIIVIIYQYTIRGKVQLCVCVNRKKSIFFRLQLNILLNLARDCLFRAINPFLIGHKVRYVVWILRDSFHETNRKALVSLKAANSSDNFNDRSPVVLSNHTSLVFRNNDRSVASYTAINVARRRKNGET